MRLLFFYYHYAYIYLWCKRPISTREFIFAQIASNKVTGCPSGPGVNTTRSRDCAYRRGPVPNRSCRTGGGHGVRVRFCLEGSEVGSGISTSRGVASSPLIARCKLIWCTEPCKGAILYVEFTSFPGDFVYSIRRKSVFNRCFAVWSESLRELLSWRRAIC